MGKGAQMGKVYPKRKHSPGDYDHAWNLIRATVWAASYDLADIRGEMDKGKGRPSDCKTLTQLRNQVTWMLIEAGYTREDTADFLYISETAVTVRVRTWRAQRPLPAVPPTPGSGQ